MIPSPTPDGGEDYDGQEAGSSTARDRGLRSVDVSNQSLQDAVTSLSSRVDQNGNPVIPPNEDNLVALQRLMGQLDLTSALIHQILSETLSWRPPSEERDMLVSDLVQQVHTDLISHPLVVEAWSAFEVPSRSVTPARLDVAEPTPLHPRRPPHPTTLPAWRSEQPSRPDPNSNHDVSVFLYAWRHDYEANPIRVESIGEEAYTAHEMIRPATVTQADVAGDERDMQGINWSRLGTTRKAAQKIRGEYHEHPTLRRYPIPTTASRLPDTRHLFRFDRMHTRHRVFIEHFQLRNLVAMTSYNDIHYVSRSKIMSTNHAGTKFQCTMDLTGSTDSHGGSTEFNITTLAKHQNLLLAGGYRGEYAIQDLTSTYGTAPTVGHISPNPNSMVNHIDTSHSRSTTHPLATFSCNDGTLRILDVHSSTSLSTQTYPHPINCTATSPNARLRLLVGDFPGALITDADSGRILARTSSTSGDAGNSFACAWADDDIHIATASEDNSVLVFDARNWSSPLASMACEAAPAMALRFSPVGGGAPVLVIAEAADAVGIVDARRYREKQVLRFCGDGAGVAMAEDGGGLVVGCGDGRVGGLMVWERDWFERGGGGVVWDKVGTGGDWLSEREMQDNQRVRLNRVARRRRNLRLEEF